MKKNNLYLYDQKIKKSYKRILGLDEVGRGSIGGPLVVVGIILKDNYYNENIIDSKKIKTIEKRKKIALNIIENCIQYKIKIFLPKDVDKLNPKQCSIIGMEQIAISLIDEFDIALTDYEKIKINKKQLNLVKGDSISYSIAAASIVAKYIRDNHIINLNNKYPEYDLINNHGYLTQNHKILLKKYGPNKEIHRFSYKPINKK